MFLPSSVIGGGGWNQSTLFKLVKAVKTENNFMKTLVDFSKLSKLLGPF